MSARPEVTVAALAERGGRFLMIEERAGGRLVLNLLASVSQWEREAIGERTRVALQHLQAQGAHIGSAPFGRAWTATGELVPVDDEIETVQLVRQLRHEGLSLREIADRLTADGRKTKRGGRWYPSTIRNDIVGTSTIVGRVGGR